MTIKELAKKLIPSFLLNIYHYNLALLSAVLFWFPSKKLIVIGVTGTSGKSTTVDFITRILEEAGNKVVSNSSIRFKVGGKEWPNNTKMGMPGRFFMQKLLRQGIKEKCNYAVLEITSQGILQYRHKFINFKTSVFTNLTPEHIEAHGGFENYRTEKLKLFRAAKNTHIVNLDDPNSDYFLKIIFPQNAVKKWGFGFKGLDLLLPDSNLKTIFADNILELDDGLKFSIMGTEFNLNLLGRFNIYNALAAICVGLSEGVSLDICKRALEKIKDIAGRMEVVVRKPFTVIVDYAHTPKQLESVYKSLQGKPLICVLGSCGGGRDKWKRPILGKIAKDYCKEVIITNEDPYDEDPMAIIEDVAGGAAGKAQKILDRREAIKRAIRLATPYDTVVITGKGSEPWMCIENNKKIPWDDCQVAREELLKFIN
ncbi:MAG: UDP-N-acetylmuramoyl-L-alanyl-D-glutamate--2,6-diaminopimelate ligase [Candidatus Staskawiczbacteria bacterium]|nr:UDP-N-acetylmuramoyl-L-alanyl-D-glutamate--2,6-diaminopimelate ligase [Candidatus Staskawiczbacteria bacterium]MBI3337018.1 UDP-N-acetylmuramoyl-L-alanyl-D-glutamate--2,6-diaminopimelate ligase [Candidatus Staskawiczbacteria bacterium]